MEKIFWRGPIRPEAPGVDVSVGPVDIGDLICGYMALEHAYDGLIEEQSRMHRHFWNASSFSNPQSAGISLTRGPVECNAMSPLLPVLAGKESIGIRKFSELRGLISLSRHLIPEGHLSGRRRFINETTPEQLADFEQLETDIQALQCDLDTMEARILETAPVTAKDAVKKLKFVVCLLLDQRELELDHFAFIVEECASAIAAELTGCGNSP